MVGNFWWKLLHCRSTKRQLGMFQFANLQFILTSSPVLESAFLSFLWSRASMHFVSNCHMHRCLEATQTWQRLPHAYIMFKRPLLGNICTYVHWMAGKWDQQLEDRRLVSMTRVQDSTTQNKCHWCRADEIKKLEAQLSQLRIRRTTPADREVCPRAHFSALLGLIAIVAVVLGVWTLRSTNIRCRERRKR